MPALACAKCAKFMRILKNGVVIEEGMPGPEPGVWSPYKLWFGDLYVCPGCGAQMISGFGPPYNHAYAEHYEPDYAEKRKKYPPHVIVNDCGGAKP